MSYVQVPPDGAGKKIYSKTQTVGADQVEAQVMHIADSEVSTHLLAVDNLGAASVRFAEGQPILAGFGGLKIANERAIGVYESSLDTYDDLFSIELLTGGALTYSSDESSEVLSVTGVNGSSSKVTTNRYHYYLPGAANVIKMTAACGDTGKSGNSRRWGAYDDNDGIFFELQGTTKNVVIRSSVTGSVVETRISQVNWNGDVLDGTGKSGVNMDITKVQVWWMDYQWLGAGRVRFGLIAPDGSRITCHTFENAGAYSLPYMRTGTLPLRAENINTGSAGSSSELRIVCLAMYTEGTYEDYSFWRYSDVDASAAAVNTEVVVASIRAKSTINSKHNSVVIFPETLNVYTDQPVAITLWQDTVVTGGTWDTLASAADVNYITTVSTAAATKFKTLYFQTGATSISLDSFFEKNDEAIQVKANGVPEVWSISAKKLGATNANIQVNLGYKELW